MCKLGFESEANAMTHHKEFHNLEIANLLAQIEDQEQLAEELEEPMQKSIQYKIQRYEQEEVRTLKRSLEDKISSNEMKRMRKLDGDREVLVVNDQAEIEEEASQRSRREG